MPAFGMAVVLVLGLGFLLVRGARTGELDATRPGILAEGPVAELEPRDGVCQAPLDLDKPVRRLGLALEGGGPPGPRLDVELRRAGSNAVLATATVPENWTLAPGAYFGLELSRRVPAETTIAVCARNAGRREAVLIGKQAIANSRVAPGNELDWAVFFPLAEGDRRSYLRMTGDMARRASVLRPGIVTPLLYGVLAVALLVGGPLLLARAARAATEPD